MKPDQPKTETSAPVSSTPLLADGDPHAVFDDELGWMHRDSLAIVNEMRAELKAYRDGGVTEEILRRNDGYIKVGRGCVIALASEVSANAAGEPQPRKPRT